MLFKPLRALCRHGAAEAHQGCERGSGRAENVVRRETDFSLQCGETLMTRRIRRRIPAIEEEDHLVRIARTDGFLPSVVVLDGVQHLCERSLRLHHLARVCHGLDAAASSTAFGRAHGRPILSANAPKF
jgi:hypothetical protein